MKKIMSVVAGAVLLATSSLGAVAAPPSMMGMHPHMDNGQMRSQVIAWCKSHPWESDCHDWNHGPGPKWGDADYQRWYYRHRGEHGFNPAWAAFFGIAAAVGAAANH